MKHQQSILLVGLGSLLLLGMMIAALPAQNASAQCKSLSACKNCHETQEQATVSTLGVWHSDHAAYDFCDACHGGVRDASAAEAAHVGVTTQLKAMSGQCGACHAEDLESRLNTYAATLNVTVDQTGLQTVQQRNPLSSFVGAQPVEVDPKSASQQVPLDGKKASAQPINQTGNLILAGLLVVGVIGGGSYVTWNERRLAQKSERRTGWLVEQIRKEHWSPYAAGVLLGITCILAVLLAQHLLGASSAIASIASNVVQKAAPDGLGKGIYFKFIMPPGFNWEIALLVGIFLGGMLGAVSSGTFGLHWNNDPTWKKVFGTQRWRRFVIGFGGAILLQIGAGIAGGCTSGLAISGGMLLAPSAFLFMAGMFISGIVVTWIIFRKRY